MARAILLSVGGAADLRQVTALASDVLEGKVIVDANGNPLTGTMPDQSGWEYNNLPAGQSVNIPEGYHDGSEYVKAQPLSSQTFGTGTAEDVLEGETVWVNGEQINGEMANNGAFNYTLSAGGSVLIPAGYHNGQGRVAARSLTNQTDGTATANDILDGETAWVDGVQIEGAMANRGAVNQSLNAGGSYTIPEGYHNGSGVVKANSLASQTPGTADSTMILDGETAWVDGELVEGTMPNQNTYSVTDVANEAASSWLNVYIYRGAYLQSIASHNNRHLLHISYPTLRNVLGITTDKILWGQSIAGSTGSAQGWYDSNTDIFRNGVFGGWGLEIVSGSGVNFSANTSEGGIQGGTPAIETTRQIDFTDISQINLHTTHISGSAGVPYYARVTLLDTGQVYNASSQSPGIGATASFYIPVSAQVKSRIRVEIVCPSSSTQGIRITVIWMSKR